jgi:hypothetical protein
MCHHASFIGKDFRTILQVAPFVFFPYMKEEMKALWFSLCYLSSVAFQTCIPDMETCIQGLELIIREFMYHISKMSGQWSNKPKVHMLLHLPQSIRQFGPASLFATEKFESYNGIVRTASIHSNRQAPSRDLAHSFANYQIERLLFSGAYLYDVKSRGYFQASSHVTNIFHQNLLIQKSFGYNSTLIKGRIVYPYIHNTKLNQADIEQIPEILRDRFPTHKIRQVAAIKLNPKEIIHKGMFYLVSQKLQD